MIDSSLYEFIALDLPAIVAACAACVSCALLGSFLLLRRLSMMGDAVSHSVLPGIVLSFLIFGTRDASVVFLGAIVAGVCSAVLIEVVRVFGKVDTGAAMGVVFTLFFALGVVLMEQAAANSIDLDADCVLHGQLESIFWLPPKSWHDLFTISSLVNIPNEVTTSILVMFIVIGFVGLFFKELMLVSFDAAIAETLGFYPRWLHQLLMIMLAISIVASFKAVGAILVVAMIVIPAASARFFTDKLSNQLYLSSVIAIVSVCGGYLIGTFGASVFGFESSFNAAGSISVFAGFLFIISFLLAPQYGLIGRILRRLMLTVRIIREDMLARLYRVDERNGAGFGASLSELMGIAGGSLLSRYALWRARRNNEIKIKNDKCILTDYGKKIAIDIIRAHRLWEAYLVDVGGIDAGRVHDAAMDFEHVTSENLRNRLAEVQKNPERDPHGRAIP